MAHMDPGDMREMLEVLVAIGPRLIIAGYAEIAIGGITMRLAAAVPVPVTRDVPAPDPLARQRVDPLRDPSTFAGGHVPRYADKLTKDGDEYPYSRGDR